MEIIRRTISRTTGEILNSTGDKEFRLIGPSFFFAEFNIERLTNLPTQHTIYIDDYGDREFCRFKVHFSDKQFIMPQQIIKAADEVITRSGHSLEPAPTTEIVELKSHLLRQYEVTSTNISVKRLMRSIK